MADPIIQEIQIGLTDAQNGLSELIDRCGERRINPEPLIAILKTLEDADRRFTHEVEREEQRAEYTGPDTWAEARGER